MNQQQHISPVDDSELTIATPHFTIQEVQAARPVVPLANTGSFVAPSVNPQGRSSWPLSLVIISAVLGGIAGGLALNFYQERQAKAVIPPPTAAVAPQPSAPATNSSIAVTRENEATVTPDSTVAATEASRGTLPESETAATTAASRASMPTRTEVTKETTADTERDKASRADASRKATTNDAPSRSVPNKSDEPVTRSERHRSNNADEGEERAEVKPRKVERRETAVPPAIKRERDPLGNQPRIREGIRDIFEGRQPR